MTSIEVIQGDITKQHIDVIVNAANSSLMGGGGVDGAIHRTGGPQILESCRKIIAKQGSCKTGEAVITTGGKLPAKFVIHTVGPVWRGGNNNEEQLLANSYANSLKLAAAYSITSIAFPNISTGIYGFPKDKAAIIAVQTIRKFTATENSFTEIIFVCFDKENYDLYNRLLQSNQ